MTIQSPGYGAENRQIASLGRLVLGSLAFLHSVACEPVDGLTPQTDVITITSPDSSAEYSVLIARQGVSETIAITTDGTATATEAATALAAAIEANTLLSGLVDASSAAGVVTITWRKGLAGTVTLVANPSDAMALVTTAIAETQYAYGEFVESAAPSGVAPEGLQRTGIQKPAGSGVRFGIVIDDMATTPDDIEEVTGPRAGTAVTVAFPSGNGEILAAKTGETTVTDGAPVYVGSSGAEKGLAYKGSGSGRVLTSFQFVRVASTGVAHIRC